jgi:tripartite-type tricarboxylate transporter receptor subunit TctC
MSAALLSSMAGVSLVHVPYKGASAALNDVMGGQVQMTIDVAISAMPQVKAGKLRALAITSGKRSSLMPELPTIAESGLPGYDMSGWFGTVAPAGTPAAVVASLNREYVRALRSPEVRERLEGYGFEVVGNTPEEFASRMRNESQRLARVIQESGAKPE